MLLDELVLITLELQELFTIDDNTTHATCTAGSSIRRNERDTRTPCIGSCKGNWDTRLQENPQ